MRENNWKKATLSPTPPPSPPLPPTLVQMRQQTIRALSFLKIWRVRAGFLPCWLSFVYSMQHLRLQSQKSKLVSSDTLQNAMKCHNKMLSTTEKKEYIQSKDWRKISLHLRSFCSWTLNFFGLHIPLTAFIWNHFEFSELANV